MKMNRHLSFVTALIAVMVLISCNLPFDLQVVAVEEETAVVSSVVEGVTETPPPLATQNPVLLSESTIGPGGGRLETADFVLDIPAGALNTEVNLKLSAPTESSPSAGQAVTGHFQVDGLPAELTQPLEVRLRLNGLLSNQSYLAAGMPSVQPEDGSPAVFFHLFPGSEEGGYLVGQLPAYNNQAPIATRGGLAHLAGRPVSQDLGGAIAMQFLGATNFEDIRSEHFKLGYAVLFRQESGYVLNLLEEVYTEFENLGFELKSLKKPILAVIIDLPENVQARYKQPYPGPGLMQESGYIEINQKLVQDVNNQKMRMAVARAFLWVVANGKDRLGQTTRMLERDRVWFHNAVAQWVQEKMVASALFSPPAFKGKELLPLRGLRVIEEDINLQDAIINGVGLSPVMKYLSDKYGKSTIPNIYEQLNTSNRIIRLLLDQVPDPASAWLPDFYKEYVSGHIYNVGADIFLNAVTDTFNIPSDKSISTTFSSSMWNLSAKLYRVNILTPNLNPQAKLRFSLSNTDKDMRPEEMQVVVFVVLSGQPMFYRSGQEVLVEDVSQWAKNGVTPLVLVVDSAYQQEYDGGHDNPFDLKIDLTVPEEAPTEEATPQQPVQSFDYSRIVLHFVLRATVTHTEGGVVTTKQRDNFSIVIDRKFQFASPSISLNWHDLPDPNYPTKSDYKGTATITLDPVTYGLREITYDQTEITNDTDEWNKPRTVTEIRKFTATFKNNIAYKFGDELRVGFSANPSGDGTVTSFYYYRETTATPNWPAYIEEATQANCSKGCNGDIRFMK